MTNQRLGLRVAGIAFGLICVGHVIRIFAQVPVRIGTYDVPTWPSILAAALTAALTMWLFLLSKPKGWS